MKITTRNLLAEMLLEASDDHIAALAIHCFASYSRASAHAPTAMEVEQFLQPAPEADREAVLKQLRTNSLLSWAAHEHSQRVTVDAAFVSDWREITERLRRFDAVLQAWSRKDGETALVQAVRKGVVLFDHQLFFEVHEVLEAQWFRTSGDEKLFLQGLIQVAVAFHHLHNRNLRGALALLQDGMDKLVPYQPVFLGVELREFLAQVEVCRREMERLGEKGLEQFRSEMIPRLHVGDV
jgi:hypothetical protein